MRSAKYFCLIFLFFQISYANEHGEPAPSEHGGGAAAEKEYSGKQSQVWSEVQTKLAALKAKVDAQEAVVKGLLHETSGGGGGGGHEASPPPAAHGGASAGAEGHAAGKIEQLKKENEKLQTLTAQYNKMNTEYETKFPEKGLKESRIYRRVDPQSTDPAENSSTNYDTKLKQLQNKILKQYPKAAKTLEKPKKEKTHNTENSPEHKEKKPDSEAAKQGDVTDQIILQK